MRNNFCLFSLLGFLLLSSSLSQLITIPLTQTPAASKTSKKMINFISATENTSNLNNFKGQYKAEIQVGSENSQFNVVLDTSSSKLWIPDSTTKASVSQKFDCSKSKTCKPDTADSSTLFYSAGNVTGYSATDKITLQGAVIPQFKFLLAKDISLNLTSYNGVLGLGLKSSSQTDPTFLEALKSNNLIKETVFSLYLASSDSTRDGTIAGDLTLGGYNPNYIQNPFQFVKLTDSPDTPYWTLNLVGLGYGSTKNVSDVSNIPVKIDTGSNLMILPKSVMLNFIETSGLSITYDADKGQYFCLCNPNKVYPDLVLYFNGLAVNISSNSYFTKASSKCYLNMKSLTKDASLAEPAVIGGAVLKDYYTLFSAENRTIGFSKVKQSSPLSMTLVFGFVFLGVIIIVASVYYCTREKGAQIGGGNGNYTALGNIGGGKGVAIGGSSNNTRPPYSRYYDENQSM